MKTEREYKRKAQREQLQDLLHVLRYDKAGIISIYHASNDPITAWITEIYENLMKPKSENKLVIWRYEALKELYKKILRIRSQERRKIMFYPIVYKTRDGKLDMLTSNTKHVAIQRMKMLKKCDDVVKVGILTKGKYRYFEILQKLAKIGW